MTTPYVLPPLDFTPAPGWEYIMRATPEKAQQSAQRVHEIATRAFETAVRSRHIMITHQETIESNDTIAAIMTLQSQMCQFLSAGRWNSDWVRPNRTNLPEPIRQQIGPCLQVINATHHPLPFGACVRAWQEHAIQPTGADSVSFRTALDDWKRLAEDFRQEAEYPPGFRGIYLGFDPPPMPGTRPPRGDYEHIFRDVTYDPALGYRAALHVLRLGYAGSQYLRNKRREADTT